MRLRTYLAVMLSLPFLAVLLAFDVMKLPVLMLVIFPIFGLMDLIAVLRGENAVLPKCALGFAFMGVAMWLEIVGIPEPKWMDIV